jgi:outer membrane protein OmpA-like peptidoglycan-associated protein
MKTACKMGAFAILLLGLAACGTTDRSMVAAMAGKGDQFAQSLHEFYLKLGDRERAEYDWRDSDHFYEKALAAASGAKVEPDAVASRDIAADKVDELAKARESLVAALGSGVERQPRAAALAQSSFDCWLEQQEEGHQAADIKACKDDFGAAMKVLNFMPKAAAPASTPAPAPARVAGRYVVHFDFNGIDPDSEGGRTIQQIAADFKTAKPKKVIVTGHTDRVGSEKANMRLGLDRAQMVMSSLIAAGVPAGAMATRSMGEAHPAVSTADNVREPGNRRV